MHVAVNECTWLQAEFFIADGIFHLLRGENDENGNPQRLLNAIFHLLRGENDENGNPRRLSDDCPMMP